MSEHRTSSGQAASTAPAPSLGRPDAGQWPHNVATITVPAHRDFVGAIRALARSSAVLADLCLEDVEELQLAVDEAATLILPLVDPEATWLRARFEVGPRRLVTILDLKCRESGQVDRHGLAWVMLTAIDPGVVVHEENGHVSVEIVRGDADGLA